MDMGKHLYLTHERAHQCWFTHTFLQSVFIDWSLTRHQMSLLLLIPYSMPNESILHTVTFEGLGVSACARVCVHARSVLRLYINISLSGNACVCEVLCCVSPLTLPSPSSQSISLKMYT